MTEDRELAIQGWTTAVECYHDDHGVRQDREEFEHAIRVVAPDGLPGWLVDAIWQRLGWSS